PEIAPFSGAALAVLDALCANFSEADGAAVKAIEARTNHDVKAIEYFLRERFAGHAELARSSEFIHFACTSEDINNLAYSLMIRDARDGVLLPALDRVVDALTGLAR